MENIASTFKKLLVMSIGAAIGLLPVEAAITLPQVIGSHMVLQRGMPVPIWGRAAPNEAITVSFRDQKKSTTADAQGKWMVKLDPLQVGDPATLTVAGSNTITLTDVLVGEVWLGSGQSNMDTPVSTYVTDTMPTPPPPEANSPGHPGPNYKDAANKFHVHDEALAQLAQGTYPQLRLFSRGALQGSGKFVTDPQGWRQANPKTLAQFSALLFAFGQPLQKELNVPVGLIFGALGATSSEQWISKEAYESDEDCKAALTKFAATYDYDGEEKKYETALAAWERATGTPHQQDAQSEPPPTAPATPLPEPPPPDPSDKPASGGKLAKPRAPYHPGDVTRDLRLPNKNIGDLYEALIRPYIPYAIRGVLWDQGEGGTGIFGLDQNTLMRALIHGWRQDWAQGDFPFIYVQKPSGGGAAWDPADPVTQLGAAPFMPLPDKIPPTRAGLEREDYLRLLTYPNTAMVISSDLGTGTHPINKAGYGARASRVALGMVYGEKIEIYGPLYDSFKVEGDKIRINYTHVGQGLAFRPGDKLQGFEIAGDDKVFYWADAVIDGSTVLVSSDRTPKPVAVRYAWDKYISWANLFNKDGLPAQAFRTDDWRDETLNQP